MKRFFKPMTVMTAVLFASACFTMSNRSSAQSLKETRRSADYGEEDVIDFTLAEPKLKDVKTLDQVRELYNQTFAKDVLLKARISGNGADLTIGGPVPGGTYAGGEEGGMVTGKLMGMVMGLGAAPPDPRQHALNKINDLRKKLSAASEEDRPNIAEQLRGALSEYFLVDMQLRVKELDEIKARVEKMEAKLQQRLDTREEAVDLQLKLFLRDAEGLGFFRSGDAPAADDWGMGEDGFGSDYVKGSAGSDLFGPRTTPAPKRATK